MQSSASLLGSVVAAISALPRKLRSRLTLWTVAVRDSFVVLLPLTFFGVAATLLGNLPFPAIHRLIDPVLGPGWQAATQSVVNATSGVFGLALAVVLSMQLARRLPVREGEEALPQTWTGVATLMNFMLYVMLSSTPSLAVLGHDSMLLGIVIGLVTPELLRLLAALPALRRISPAYDSDPTFYYAVRMTPPLMIVSLTVVLAAEVQAALPPLGMHWLAVLPPAINAWMDADWLLNSGAVLFNQLLWFFGIHGGKVLDQQAQALFGIAGSAYTPALAWRPLIDIFVHLGGSGATLGLILALLVSRRKSPFQRLGLVSLLPSLFNINELLIFGLPIALNPIFLRPFLLAPLALTGLALTAVHTGLVQMHNIAIPWTTPPLLSGYLLTDSWRGAALQAVGLLVSTLIYLPFVRQADARRVRDQAETFDTATQVIVSQSRQYLRSVQRNDQVGLIARGLLLTLTRDLGTPAVTLAFQPKHDCSGAAVSMEALLRWTHGRHGPIRADVAVTLAEDGGLIRRLGAWVLEEACARKAHWNTVGLSHITMAINVSPFQLNDPQLPELIAHCLKRYRLAPNEIELEITESQSIPVHKVVDQNLAQIVSTGVSLAMDDFGMGYSSLLHMRRFHIHAIKIDGSLTRDVLTNPTSCDIIRSIGALGRSRQVEVVAEFVETMEQRDVLETLGCNVFQGYLYSPPLPAAACVEYLLAHSTHRNNAALPATPPLMA